MLDDLMFKDLEQNKIAQWLRTPEIDEKLEQMAEISLELKELKKRIIAIEKRFEK